MDGSAVQTKFLPAVQTRKWMEVQCKRNFCPQSKQNYFRRTIPLSDQNIETGIKVYVHKILDLAI